jgi:imidazolonepropionase-like amidohydrolase
VPEAFAIVGARVIDGTGAAPLPSGAVYVGDDGRIASVGPRGSLPNGMPVLHAEGLTLLPGLIDGHVHLTWDKTLYGAYSAKDYETRLALRDEHRQLVRAGHFAQTALAAGVTTLRDCGADDFSVLALRHARRSPPASSSAPTSWPRDAPSPPRAAISTPTGVWTAGRRSGRRSGSSPAGGSISSSSS